VIALLLPIRVYCTSNGLRKSCASPEQLEG
jgi:hypothetical protein